MLLDSGLLTICELVNIAGPGNKPLQKLNPLAQQWYGERTIGYNRQYAAKSVNEQVDMLVRIWAEDIRPSIGHYVIVDDDMQYRVDNVTLTADEDGLTVYDMTLARLENHYDVIR